MKTSVAFILRYDDVLCTRRRFNINYISTYLNKKTIPSEILQYLETETKDLSSRVCFYVDETKSQRTLYLSFKAMNLKHQLKV